MGGGIDKVYKDQKGILQRAADDILHSKVGLAAMKAVGFADKQVLQDKIRELGKLTSQQMQEQYIKDLVDRKILNLDASSRTSLKDIRLNDIDNIYRSSRLSDFPYLKTDGVFAPSISRMLLKTPALPFKAFNYGVKKVGSLYESSGGLFDIVNKKSDKTYSIDGKKLFTTVLLGAGMALTGMGLWELAGHSAFGYGFMGLGALNLAFCISEYWEKSIDPTSDTAKFLKKVNGFSWIVTTANLVGASALLFHSDIGVSNLLKQSGLPLEAGGMILLFDWVGRAMGRSAQIVKMSRGGHVMPGQEDTVMSMTKTSAASLAFEKLYMNMRMTIALPVLLNLVMHAGGVGGGIGLLNVGIFLGVPTISLISRMAITSRVGFDPNSKGSILPYAQFILPALGLMSYTAVALATGQLWYLQTYVMYMGSLAMLAAEFHSIWFSRNTSRGSLRGSATSSRLPIGATEIREDASKLVNMSSRTDTGLKESSLGVLFTAILGIASPTLWQCDSNLNEKNYDKKTKIKNKEFEAGLISRYRTLLEAIGEADPKKEKEARDELKKFLKEEGEKTKGREESIINLIFGGVKKDNGKEKFVRGELCEEAEKKLVQDIKDMEAKIKVIEYDLKQIDEEKGRTDGDIFKKARKIVEVELLEIEERLAQQRHFKKMDVEGASQALVDGNIKKLEEQKASAIKTLSNENGIQGRISSTRKDLINQLNTLKEKYNEVKPKENDEAYITDLAIEAYIGKLPSMYARMSDYAQRNAFLKHISSLKKRILDSFIWGIEKVRISDVEKLAVTYRDRISELKATLKKNHQEYDKDKHDTYVQYLATIDNLKNMANELKKIAIELPGDIAKKSGKKWFHWYNAAESTEYVEANMRAIAQKIEMIMRAASELERDLNENRVSLETLKRKIAQEVEIDGYDENRKSQIVAVARKANRFDDKRVQKELNVSSYLLSRGFTLYEMVYDEIDGQVHKTIDNIAGTWTRMLNPHYDVYAKPGSFEASPVIWVKTKMVMTEMNRHDGGPTEILADADRIGSTSEIVRQVNNTPIEEEGYSLGEKGKEVTINEHKVTLKAGEYFFQHDLSKGGIPEIKGVILREEADKATKKGIKTYEDNGKRFVELSKEDFIEKYNSKEAGPFKKKDLEFLKGKQLEQCDTISVVDKMDVSFQQAALASLVKFREHNPNAYVAFSFTQPNGEGRYIPRDYTKQVMGDFVEDCQIYFWYGDGDKRQYIPYVMDSGAMKKTYSLGDEMKLSGAKVTKKDGKIIKVDLVYENLYDQKQEDIEIRQSEWPMYLEYIKGIPDNKVTTISGDDFTVKKTVKEVKMGVKSERLTGEIPNRGDIWLIFDSKKGKDGAFILGKGNRAKWRDQLGRPAKGEEKAHLSNGILSPVRKAFFAAANVTLEKFGYKIGKGGIDFSGKIYITKDGTYTPIKPAGNSVKDGWQEVTGCVGLVVGPGSGSQGRYVDLKDLVPRDIGETQGQKKYARANNIIEIVAGDEGNVIVKERRMLTGGNEIDSSKYLYAVDLPGLTKELLEKIKRLDLGNPKTKVNITKEGARITDGELDILIPAKNLIDNYGKALFENAEMNIVTEKDIYQSDTYTQETEAFKPVLDYYPDRGLVLRVDIITSHEKKAPPSLEGLEKGQKVFASAAYSAVKYERVDEEGEKTESKWIPLNEVLPDVKANRVEYKYCGIERAETVSMVNQQNRLGWSGKLLIKLRDLYFYGLEEYTTVADRLNYGTNFGLEFFKGSVGEGICSGRTYISWWNEYLNPHTTIKQTNSPLSNKLQEDVESQGTAVGEDEKMKQILRAFGKNMDVIKTPFDLMFLLNGNIMPAEMKIGNWINQTARRYDFSEMLFARRWNYFVKQELHKATGFMFPEYPELIAGEQGAELGAGKYWYKYPAAQLMQFMAPVVYVGTAGIVPFLPFDNVLMMAAWTGKNMASPYNYVKQLSSLGIKGWKAVKTGFVDNQSIEYSVLLEMFNVACRQYLDRNQWANFILTSGGSNVAVDTKQMGFAIASTLISAGLVYYGFSQLGGFGMLGASGGFSFGIGATTAFLGLQTVQFTANLGYMWSANQKLKKANKDEVTRLEKIRNKAQGLADEVNKATGTDIQLPGSRVVEDNSEFFTKDTLPDHLKASYKNYEDLAQEYEFVVENKPIDFNAPYSGIKYGDLIVMRERMKKALIGFGAIGRDGMVRVDEIKKTANLAVTMLDFYSKIEDTICRKARFELIKDPNNKDAEDTLVYLGRDTTDFYIGYEVQQTLAFAGLYANKDKRIEGLMARLAQ